MKRRRGRRHKDEQTKRDKKKRRTGRSKREGRARVNFCVWLYSL